MTLLDRPFTIRFRTAEDADAAQLWIGDACLGQLESVTCVRPAPDATERRAPSLFDGAIHLGEPALRLWVEHVRRVRRVEVDADRLLASAARDLARHGDAERARAVVEHVLGWAGVHVRVATGDAVPARVVPQTEAIATWDDEPWAYRRGDIARRANPRKLPLHAPEFDASWSNEYRAVLMVAPEGRAHNSIPLLATYVRPWSYEPAFWDREIVQILRDAAGAVPRDPLALDDWYPPPDGGRPDPRGDLTDWTSRRLLDGFSGLPLQYEPGSDRYVMEIDWSDVPANDGYELPNVAVFWERAAGGGHRLSRVDVAARRWWHAGNRLPDDWRDDPSRWFDVRSVTPSDGERAWQHALFVARSAVLLAGEVDVHLARTHLLVEAYALMLAVHGQDTVLAPVRALLGPFLRDVSGINRLGDALIMGRGGLLVVASGLNAKAMQRRLARQTAATDWKGFAPRDAHPLMPDARYPVAAQAWWRGIRAMVHRVLGDMQGDRNALVAALGDCVDAHNTRFGAGLVLEPRAGADFAWPQEWRRQLDERRRRISRPETFADVEQLCAYVIFHATFVHGWVNDEAWIDGGSLRHAVFGLRDLDAPRAGQPWDDWWRQVGPARKHAAMQLSIGWTLDRLAWGRMDDPNDPDRRETRDKAKHGELEIFQELQAAMERGRPTPASELERIGRPLAGWRIRINS